MSRIEFFRKVEWFGGIQTVYFFPGALQKHQLLLKMEMCTEPADSLLHLSLYLRKRAITDSVAVFFEVHRVEGIE